LEKDTLTPKSKVSDIPPFARDFLNRLTTDRFSIANSGELWQATDVVYEKLPARQFIYLGVGKNTLLLSHLTAGIGKLFTF
jgi:hypothetical protein